MLTFPKARQKMARRFRERQSTEVRILRRNRVGWEPKKKLQPQQFLDRGLVSVREKATKTELTTVQNRATAV